MPVLICDRPDTYQPYDVAFLCVADNKGIRKMSQSALSQSGTGPLVPCPLRSDIEWSVEEVAIFVRLHMKSCKQGSLLARLQEF